MNTKYPKHHLVKTGHIGNCQICNSKKLHMILDLGYQPLCDTLLSKADLDKTEITYPLHMMWCESCSGVQIDYCVDGKVVYHPNYPYKSGISKPLVEYQRNMATSLTRKYNLGPRDLVIDIGSNDGTLLDGFKKNGVKILGVEPTNIAKFANKNGIRTIQSFFDIKESELIKRKYGNASLITTTNVFAHMQTIGEFIMGIHNLLKDDGVFISETHYLLDVIDGGQFDTIYHEHLRTYSLKSLIKLFSYYDFTVIDVERGSRYGGNIRVHVMKGKNRKICENVTKLLKLEEKSGLGKIETYRNFARSTQNARNDFVNFMIKIKKSGKSVVGKSCPGRASTLLNYYGIGTETLPYLAELPDSLKLGMYLPGKHIPIVNEKILYKEQPNYVVILSWHYGDVIMARLKKAGLKSDFIIPLPNFKVIKNIEIK